MPDKGHIETDKILNDLEKKLDETYKQAAKEMGDKLNEQTQKYQKKLDEMNEKLANGTISKDAYTKWKQSQSIQKLHLEQMCDTLAEDLTHTDEIAAAIINGHTPDVYALNYNFSTYEIEKGINASTSFVLYNHETVEHILRDNPDLLPQPKVNIAKDLKWNKQHINNAITQGILQGESIPKISKRMVETVGMSRNSAIRNARTATTGAQSMGRVDAYKRAENMGINVKQKWLATLDGRTRHTHRLIDGEIVDVGSKFSNNCRFPGDPQGPGSEVYNCRCTLVPVLKGFERPDDWKQRVIDYDEWKEGGTGYARWLEDQAAPDSAIQSIWGNKKMSQMYNEIKAINTTDANKFYKELGKLGKPSEVWDQYLKGQLDAEDLKNFEEILKKYLPKETPLDDYAEWLKQWQGKGIFHMDVPFDVITHVQNKGVNDIMQYWKKYIAQEIKDPDLDKILGYKKLDKLADTAKTVNKIDNISDAAKAEDIINYKKTLPKHLSSMDEDKFDEITKIINNKIDIKTTTSTKYWQQYLDGKVNDSDLDALLKTYVSKENKIAATAAQDSLNSLKIKAGNPMTKAEADTYKVNPFYDVANEATTKNCQTSAFAYECRRQGYDVVALPRDKTLKYQFELQNKLAEDQKKAWINVTTGKSPEAIIKSELNLTVKKADMLKELEDAIGSNNERYVLSVHWKKGGGHAINIDRDENGLLRIIDNQRGPLEKNTWIGKEVEDYFDNIKNIKNVYRVDDCIPNSTYFNNILADASKIKINTPMKLSDLPGDQKPQVKKIINASQSQAKFPDSSEVYYKKWQFGKVDNKDLDDLLVKSQTSKVTTSKTDDLLSVLNKNLSDKAWMDAWEVLENKGASDDTIDAISHKLYSIKKDQNIATKNEVLDLYLKGKIKDSELDDLFGEVYNISTKKVTSIPVPTTIPKSGTTVVDFDAIKNKKVTQVYNEIKADMSSKEANAFYNELKNIGKTDGLKQGDVWAKYLKGELDGDDVAKIDKHLINKYNKVVEPPKPEVDYFTLSNKKMSQVYNELKAENVTDANKFYNELKKHGKPSEVWEKYVNGELSEDVTSKVDSYLINKYNKGGTTTSKTAAKTAAKSDDLAKAEAELKKAQDELAKIPNKKYSGIWKDDVTLADYEQKKETIAAKKIYYKDEIDKLKNDPSYKSFWDEEKKKEIIEQCKKYINNLDEFEEKGKEYAKFQKVVEKAKKEVQNLTPKSISGKFDPSDYDDAAKKKAKLYHSKTDADKFHRQFLDSIWENLSDEEKYSIWEYTRNSNPINKSLSGYHDNWHRSNFLGYGKTDWGHEDSWRSLNGSWQKFGKDGHVQYHKVITNATKAIERSALPENVYFVRGSDIDGLAGMIEGKGFMSFDEAKKLLKSDISTIKNALEGQVVKNHAFTSTGIAKGTGFGGSVKFEIYAPKGTRAIYAEPQSYFGNTSSGSLYKAGKSYSSVGSEAEMLIQRGTEYKITEVSGTTGNLTVKMEIVDQPDYFKYGDEDTFNGGATRHKK